MKHKLYKPILTLFAIGFLGTISAQKFDKKFTENFKVNKDVEVQINASNTDINVTTWNKNEVQVDAYIEIDGITKEEAEKYFKNWNFEALGNKSKVKINANDSFMGRFGNNFTYLDNMNFDFTFPDMDFSDIEVIKIPDMDFDFDFDDFNIDLKDLEIGSLDLDEMVERDGDYEFRWKDDERDIKITSKKEWEAFKKTDDYKKLKKELEEGKKKVKEQLRVSKIKIQKDREKIKKELLENRKKIKEELAKARVEIKKINKEEIRKSLEKAKQSIKEMKINFSNENGEIIINGKKVKVKRRLEIKVPKNATFDLNTRHCKVKLPNTVASGNVKYGSLDARNLLGGRLTVNYSPVSIQDMNACTLFLNNVTDATIASVTNTKLSNNSSDVKILRVNNNVNLSDQFGEILVESFSPDFGDFILNLQNSEATLILNGVPAQYNYNVERINLNNTAKKVTNAKNSIKVNGKYSTLVIK